MSVDNKTLQERLDKLLRKDIKIITSADINILYDGLSKEQKNIANHKFRSFLLSKVKEEKIEKLERAEIEKTKEIEKERNERKKYFRGHKICKSIKKIADKIKDPQSIFKDPDFIEDITGCKIKPTKKKYAKR